MLESNNIYFWNKFSKRGFFTRWGVYGVNEYRIYVHHKTSRNQFQRAFQWRHNWWAAEDIFINLLDKKLVRRVVCGHCSKLSGKYEHKIQKIPAGIRYMIRRQKITFLVANFHRKSSCKGLFSGPVPRRGNGRSLVEKKVKWRHKCEVFSTIFKVVVWVGQILGKFEKLRRRNCGTFWGKFKKIWSHHINFLTKFLKIYNDFVSILGNFVAKFCKI